MNNIVQLFQKLTKFEMFQINHLQALFASEKNTDYLLFVFFKILIFSLQTKKQKRKLLNIRLFYLYQLIDWKLIRCFEKLSLA